MASALPLLFTVSAPPAVAWISGHVLRAGTNKLHAVIARCALCLLAFWLIWAPVVLVGHGNMLGRQSASCILAVIAFKVLALAMGRGVLARELLAGSSLWRFTGAAMLPVIPIPASKIDSTRCAADVLAKVQAGLLKLSAFTMITLIAMQVWRAAHSPGSTSLPAWATLLIKPFLWHASGMALWLEVAGMGELTDSLAISLFNVRSEPHFVFPPKAISLSELWGKRWNCTISSVLRDLAYMPVLEGRLLKPWPPMQTMQPVPSPVPSPKDRVGPAEPSCTPLQGEIQVSREGFSTPSSSPPSSTRSSTTDHPAISLSDARAFEGLQQQHVEAGAASPLHAIDSGKSVTSTASDESGNGSAGDHHERKRPSSIRRFWANEAAFAVSGLWHEVVFYLMTGAFGTCGYWTAFFMMQPVLLVVESKVRPFITKFAPAWLRMVLVQVAFSACITIFWAPPMIWPLKEGDSVLDLIESQLRQEGTHVWVALQASPAVLSVIAPVAQQARGLMATLLHAA